jgi:hypothetical protein
MLIRSLVGLLHPEQGHGQGSRRGVYPVWKQCGSLGPEGAVDHADILDLDVGGIPDRQGDGHSGSCSFAAWWDYYTQNKATGRGVAGGSTRVFARPIPLT